jgi:hypothetical protein
MTCIWCRMVSHLDETMTRIQVANWIDTSDAAQFSEHEDSPGIVDARDGLRCFRLVINERKEISQRCLQ